MKVYHLKICWYALIERGIENGNDIGIYSDPVRARGILRDALVGNGADPNLWGQITTETVDQPADATVEHFTLNPRDELVPGRPSTDTVLAIIADLRRQRAEGCSQPGVLLAKPYRGWRQRAAEIEAQRDPRD